MSPFRTSPTSRRPVARWAAAAALTASTVAVAGFTSAAPAQSAPDSQCPQPYPVADLTENQPVTGRTVSKGTAPEGFTGTVLGVLDDGIMPGIDMIMVRLSSPEIDRVGGIWSGMSGSPVYAEDGRLIGAVSYGLSFGPSPVAGVTPAADMEDMLTDNGAPALAAKRVDLPARMEKQLVASGDATAAEADSGMSQLRLPFGIAGLSSARFKTVAKKLDLDGMRAMKVGATATGSSADASSVVAGGNLAASIAYGDVTFAAVGTATVVCGQDVVGFGHPMMWTGPSTLTMHSANALFVQEDPTMAGFKLANIGAPVGTIHQDRMPGIVGAFGATPPTGDVTSYVQSGTRSRSGETHVSLPDWMPDVAMSHLLSNQDRVFDGIGKGSGTLSYTINGTRQDGTPFSLQRTDLYADKYDITFASAVDLYMTLSQLQYNGAEDITIDDVDTTSSLNRSYDHYVIKRVEMRRPGAWVALTDSSTLKMRAGTTTRLRVTLSSPVSGTRTVRVDVPVPARALGKYGSLQVFGGNTGFYDEEDYFEGSSGNQDQTFGQVLASLRKQDHNDEVVANLSLYDERGDVSIKRHRRTATGMVVDGGVGTSVRIVR